MSEKNFKHVKCSIVRSGENSPSHYPLGAGLELNSRALVQAAGDRVRATGPKSDRMTFKHDGREFLLIGNPGDDMEPELPKARAIVRAIHVLEEVQSSRKLLIDPAIVGNIELRSKPQS